jgi:NNP family nitrate/nitrite transporter-like MFS transporter
MYNVDIKTAGILSPPRSIPHFPSRPPSDRYGARTIMYWTFLVAVVCTFVLSYPPSDYVVRTIYGPRTFHLEMGVVSFTVIVFVLGFFMALGKAAVSAHPGLLSEMSAPLAAWSDEHWRLGGFAPNCLWRANDLTAVDQRFMLLFVL